MFEQLMARLPDIELTADPASLPRRRANFITGLEAMPVRFRPSRSLACGPSASGEGHMTGASSERRWTD